MSQAIQYTQLGGPEVLTVAEVPTPTPAAGEVAIRVEAAGVNPLDWKLRSGLRPTPEFTGPRGSGSDGAGTITGVGENVEGFRVGDPVAFCNASGAYASDIVVKASNVFPRPAAVSAAQGAALGIPAGTAYQVVRSLAVSARDVVLVHGGSGSVGQFVIQFARLLGARVIATSSERRAQTVRDLGAEQVTYGDGLTDRVRAVAPDVTVAIDCAGTDEAIETSLAVVADHARIVTIVRGAEADGWGIRAFMGGSPHAMTPEQLALRVQAMPVSLALMAVGALTVEIGASYPLAHAGQAQADSQDGRDGKLIITP